jgi:large subunit ribosomal protein L7/L12
MTAVAEVGDRIARLTIAEAVQVRSYLKERYGIEAAVGLGTLPNRKAVDTPLPPPEPDAFDVVIDGVAAGNKITVIKTVRELTGVGLAEAKGLVEAAPRVLRQGVDKADAEQLKAKLEKAGAKVTLKGV